MDSPPVSPFRPQKKDKKPKQSSNQKFATLSSLQQDEDSSDEEEGKLSFVFAIEFACVAVFEVKLYGL